MVDAGNDAIVIPNRERIIVRTSIIGILANLFLALFKAIVGFASNSIAVILDAVNNLTDALSSVITIIGTKLAGKKPDKKHPLGYGRVEYLTAMIIAAIILYAGISALFESVDKIINPVEADYSVISLVIIGSAVIVKVFLGRYVKSVGKKVNSSSLVASGTDALYDAILSASVFMSAIIFTIWGLSLEAYVGILISVMIIRAGIEILRDTLDDIIGKRTDEGLTDAIKETICSHENVSGAYDLILHTYGPERIIGSVHIEVPCTMTADELDKLQREIAADVMQKHGIIMAGIGVYALDTCNAEAMRIRSEISDIVMSHEGVVQMHGFRADTENKTIVFDLIIDYDLSDRDSLYCHIDKELRSKYPDYTIRMTLDADI
jgi:cation diffusion facilitator family transporter